MKYLLIFATAIMIGCADNAVNTKDGEDKPQGEIAILTPIVGSWDGEYSNDPGAGLPGTHCYVNITNTGTAYTFRVTGLLKFDYCYDCYNGNFTLIEGDSVMLKFVNATDTLYLQWRYYDVVGPTTEPRKVRSTFWLADRWHESGIFVFKD